ncbi:hypothetical protein M409DRAFT_18758 [Zasmidium cellare ATCC 36951]|uniref:Small secreted protein n=1 Tax=Zasmidium cellare ATCC 36951 TaxID=1080233 RepID=A0A6A6CUF1_ZASCE|nr:uncharacterized protein M409DRAFT_18758 [Zasmidium cellare ATCC 36951]KAF2170784.1 hypothetical protein M409DRAFT_18758 [Zasmidium cellare ATCC 36951]
MLFRSFIGLALTLACANATLDPATSNTKGKCPKTLNCSASKTSDDIQAAECAYNTRTHETQTFAVFETDHSHDDSHGAPYGTCSAYTCEVPTSSDLESDSDCWTFFWDDSGAASGVGTGCIKSPDDGTCGCENSDGEFIYGGDDCS